MKVRISAVRDQESPTLLVWDAPSVADARMQAQAQGYTVIRAEANFSLDWSVIRPASGKKNDGLLVWVEQFHALLIAGLSVIEVLDTLQRQQPNDWTQTTNLLERSLREGISLSRAMSSTGQFPPLLVSLVQSAEVTSSLPEALDRYLTHERRAAQLRHQVTSITLYPLLLLGVGAMVMLFLSLYVVPRFARIFQGMQGELPWTAQAMLAWSRALNQHGWLVAVAGILIFSGLVLPWVMPRSRAKLLAWAGQHPLIASRIEVYHQVRWYRTISMLLHGGIPLPESIQLASTVLPSYLQHRASQVLAAMRNGLSPVNAFNQGNMATTVAEQLIRAGERSGDVGPMLEKTAAFHETELTRWLERLMRVLEPVVMALIGLGIGGVVIMMYLPIFELASAIQ